MKWLEYLKAEDGHENYEAIYNQVIAELLKGNLGIADIGISEADIKVFLVRGCKAACKKWLVFLRLRQKSLYSYFMTQLHLERDKFQLSLEDIGTNKEEIMSLAPGWVPLSAVA